MSSSHKILASFQYCVPHATLHVYNASIEQPFNDWIDLHIKQGFSWRQGSIGFSTLGSQAINMEVVLAKEFEIKPQTERCIRVPFWADERGEVGVKDEEWEALCRRAYAEHESYLAISCDIHW